MTGFEMPEWGGMFVPDVSLVESFLRGTAVYFGILILFRVVLKKQAGGVGLPDVMLVVLVSECVSSAINADAKSVPNGLASVAALLFWSYAIDWVSYHSPWLRRQLEPKPITLIRDGRVVEENMRKEQMTEEELDEQLRQNGVEDPSQVKRAVIEGSGGVSVIPRDDSGGEKPPAPNTEEAAEGREADPANEPPDVDRAIAHFLTAAKKLRAAVEWHDERAAEHRRAAHAARELLSRHGLRGRKWLDHAGEPQGDEKPSEGVAGGG